MLHQSCFLSGQALGTACPGARQNEPPVGNAYKIVFTYCQHTLIFILNVGYLIWEFECVRSNWRGGELDMVLVKNNKLVKTSQVSDKLPSVNRYPLNLSKVYQLYCEFIPTIITAPQDRHILTHRRTHSTHTSEQQIRTRICQRNPQARLD